VRPRAHSVRQQLADGADYLSPSRASPASQRAKWVLPDRFCVDSMLFSNDGRLAPDPSTLLKINSMVPLYLANRRLALIVASLLLAACAGSGALPPPREGLRCLPEEVPVCRGGDASKLEREGYSEARICICESRTEIS